MNKKSQITVVELSLFFLLLSSSLFYFTIKSYDEFGSDLQVSVDTALDVIYYSDDYRSLIMDEVLTSSSQSEDWSTLSTFLDSTLSNYEFTVGTLTRTDVIFSCQPTNGKYTAQRVIAIEDNSNYEFRIVTLGVCY